MLNTILTNPITLIQFICCILTALVLGFLAALVFSTGTKYSSSWKISIALLPALVAVVIMMVNGNIGAGLAVAGTFALVRFRSQPGSAKEVTGLFFAVAIGLICGMGYVGISVVFFVIIAAATLILSKMRFGEAKAGVRNLVIVIPENLDYETVFNDIFEKYTTRCNLMRVKTTNMGTMFELRYEVALKDLNTTKEFIDEIRCRNGNLNITLARPTEDQML